MKRIFVLIAALTTFSISFCQYYNPYQQAYQWGQNLARQYQEQQQQANQQAYNWGGGLGLVTKGQMLIAEGDYEEGFEKFEEAYNDYNYYPACECLGVCYEVGIGVERNLEMADLYYEEGANHNDANSKAAIRRINAKGHYSSSHKSAIITSLKSKFANYAPYYNAGGNGNYGGPNYNSGSSSSSGRTCVSCGGSGTCKTCGGKGYYYHDTGLYVGRTNITKTTCPVCSGTGRCGTCHGQGSIR